MYDAIIIGGGAAGVFCAAQAGRRGKRVLVIEHNAEVGRKILISGGGRCNFTNIHTTAENFISENPHFCKSALSRYSADDFVTLVRKYEISYYEKKLGQLFCTERSDQIVDMLLRECRDSRVEIRTGCSVSDVRKTDAFRVQTDRGELAARSLVVACGGLSFPKIGATGLGYELAKQFGHKIVPTRPSLVAMVLEGRAPSQLAGVSVDAKVSLDSHTFRENILFTHRGLSGPAILQISNYWQKGRSVNIDLLPEIDSLELFGTGEYGTRRVISLLASRLPHKLANQLVESDLPNKRIADLTNRDKEGIAERLNQWRVNFRETEGYDRAEVTLGGVSTDGLSSRTMESRSVPGLFFIGEVVDVTGWLGGFNFQWAWSSGFAAGTAI